MFGTILLLAIRAIRRHLLRSFLTTLGIVIGVFSVVTMVTIGNGVTASVQNSISALGTSNLMIFPGQGRGRGGGGAPPPPFELQDLEALGEQVAGVRAVAGQAQSSALAIRNASNWQTQITGTSNAYFTTQNWALASGRTFTDREEAAGRLVCIIGHTVAANLFADTDPVGERMRLGSVSCEVIGVLVERGSAGFGDQDNMVVMPLKAVQRRFTGNRRVSAIIVSMAPGYDTNSIQKSVSELLRERRNIGLGEPDNFNIFDTAQLSATLAQSTRTMTLFLGALAAISLIVGGIGIMNIMLVSVTERTREIGIRLAIGALGKEVLMQFLVEAVVLACLGGVIGILLALVTTMLAAPAMGIPFLFNPTINILAFLFSGLIGIVFGYFPARRAAALNPIDALRHE